MESRARVNKCDALVGFFVADVDVLQRSKNRRGETAARSSCVSLHLVACRIEINPQRLAVRLGWARGDRLPCLLYQCLMFSVF